MIHRDNGSFSIVSIKLSTYACFIIILYLSVELLFRQGLFIGESPVVNINTISNQIPISNIFKGLITSTSLLLIITFSSVYLSFIFCIRRITVVEKVFLGVVVVSIQSFYREYAMANAAYTYFSTFLIWLLILDEGRSHIDKKVYSWLFRGQMATVYIFTALLKNGSDWLKDFSALEYTLSSSYARPEVRSLVESSILPDWLMQIGTIGTLCVELLIPLLILMPFRKDLCDKAAAFLIVSLHLMIYLFTEPLWFFVPVFSLNALLLWPEDKFLTLINDKVNTIFVKCKAKFLLLKKVKLKIWIPLLYFFSIVTSNIIELKKSETPHYEQFMSGTLSYQTWGMFSPNAPHYRVWIEIVGKNKNTGGIENLFAPHSEIGSIPDSLSEYYKDSFLRGYFSGSFNPSENDDTNEMRIQKAGSTLMHYCKELPNYLELELIYYRNKIKLQSDLEKFPIESESLVHINCKDYSSLPNSLLEPVLNK